MTPLVRNLLIEAVYWRWRASGGMTYGQLPPHVTAITEAVKMPPVATDAEGVEIIKDLQMRCLFYTSDDLNTLVTTKRPSIGITGTRHGGTDAQGIQLTRLFLYFMPSEFHHGDCVGVDADAHDLYCGLFKDDAIVIGHPPLKSGYRAHCQCSELRRELSYNARNAEIIAESDIMIAVPRSLEDQIGGTWNTIRMTRDAKKPLYIISPDGKFVREN